MSEQHCRDCKWWNVDPQNEFKCAACLHPSWDVDCDAHCVAHMVPRDFGCVQFEQREYPGVIEEQPVEERNTWREAMARLRASVVAGKPIATVGVAQDLLTILESIAEMTERLAESTGAISSATRKGPVVVTEHETELGRRLREDYG